jgi:hypothetical protein
MIIPAHQSEVLAAPGGIPYVSQAKRRLVVETASEAWGK